MYIHQILLPWHIPNPRFINKLQTLKRREVCRNSLLHPWIPDAIFVFTTSLAQFCRFKGLEKLVLTIVLMLIHISASTGILQVFCKYQSIFFEEKDRLIANLKERSPRKLKTRVCSKQDYYSLVILASVKTKPISTKYLLKSHILSHWPGWLSSIHALMQVTIGFLLFVWHFNTLLVTFISWLQFMFTTTLEVNGADVMINK